MGEAYAHPQRLEEWMTVTPRIYFTEDFDEASVYAWIEVRKSGGRPYVITVNITPKIRALLKRGTENSNEWYVEIGSWANPLPIPIESITAAAPDEEAKHTAYAFKDWEI